MGLQFGWVKDKNVTEVKRPSSVFPKMNVVPVAVEFELLYIVNTYGSCVLFVCPWEYGRNPFKSNSLN